MTIDSTKIDNFYNNISEQYDNFANFLDFFFQPKDQFSKDVLEDLNKIAIGMLTTQERFVQSYCKPEEQKVLLGKIKEKATTLSLYANSNEKFAPSVESSEDLSSDDKFTSIYKGMISNYTAFQRLMGFLHEKIKTGSVARTNENFLRNLEVFAGRILNSHREFTGFYGDEGIREILTMEIDAKERALTSDYILPSFSKPFGER